MERSAEIISINYNYDSLIPYDSKILWVQLKRKANDTAPPHLQIGSKALIVKIDHNHGQSIKSVIVADIIGSKVALKDEGYAEKREYIPRETYLVW